MAKFYNEAEKYLKDTFWSETHDASNNLNIPEIVQAKLIRDNKEKNSGEYYGHREGVVHVSSLSRCLRGVIHEMLGAKKDNEMEPRKLGVFKAGNLFEDFIVEALGERMESRQTEYVFKYKNIILTGRDDGIIIHDGKRTLLENKSVNSDSFWYRQKEGTLVSWNNLVQIQCYLWLRRQLFNDPVDGIFCYVSKDDVTVASAPVRFNPHIIDEIVIPALDIINEGYTTKNPNVAPVPSLAIFAEAKHQYQKNWLATYCEYHSLCCGASFWRHQELASGSPA